MYCEGVQRPKRGQSGNLKFFTVCPVRKQQPRGSSMAEAESIKTLNNPAESSKAKLAALARIAELARHEQPRRSAFSMVLPKPLRRHWMKSRRQPRR